MIRLYLLVCVSLLPVIAGCDSTGHAALTFESALESALPTEGSMVLALRQNTAGNTRQCTVPPFAEIAAALAGKRSRFTPAEGHLNGSQFEPDLYRNNVTALGDQASYEPDFPPLVAGTDGLAAAIYRFDLPDYDGSPVSLDLIWANTPPAGAVFAGLGSWDERCWRWFDMPVTTRQFSEFAVYVDGDDTCVLALAVIGSGAYVLEELQFAQLEPPHADIVAHPALGLTPLPVQFFAGDSFDLDGTIVLYEWDFDGDGVYDQAGVHNYSSHVFDTVGNTIVSLRVTDDDGLTAGDGVQVTAMQPEGWRLELLVPEVPLDIGFSAAIVNNRPAVAFSTWNELRYCQAADETGSAWNAWLAVEADPVREGSTALAVVSGRPAITFVSQDGQGPFFVRAFEADGAAWHVPQPAAALTELFRTQLIETMSGLPVIATSQSSAAVNSIQVVLGEDAAGASWRPAIEADSGDSGYNAPVLKLVNDLPAMTYTNADAEAVYSLSSGVPDGQDWLDETVVDSLAGSWTGPCLADISGHPALVFGQGFAPTELVYVRADDAAGTTWTGFTELDPGAELHFDVALAAVGGVAVTAYSVMAANGEDNELRFLRALDANGDDWEAPQVIGVFDQVGPIEILELADGRPALVFRVDFDELDPGLHGEALYFAVPE